MANCRFRRRSLREASLASAATSIFLCSKRRNGHLKMPILRHARLRVVGEIPSFDAAFWSGRWKKIATVLWLNSMAEVLTVASWPALRRGKMRMMRRVMGCFESSSG